MASNSSDDNDKPFDAKIALTKGAAPRPVIECPAIPPDRWYGIAMTAEQRRRYEVEGICPMCNEKH